jgi:hypothetical protein
MGRVCSILGGRSACSVVTCRPIAREQLRKQARNKYGTNNRVDLFLGDTRNTHNNRTIVAKVVFSVGSRISIARQRICFLCCGPT